MYLKEIHVENFKSFGKKLNIPFFPGFTAITGPNGSGKSNIADAILFVLGPKSSKEMRAGRLTDLIFNGGKKRKNPAKKCKVSLVFDNSERRMPVDADEVKLTRMVKRAPLKDDPDNYYSRFYINENSANFSDLQNVLQHARMSGDGYNIVKQGDVTSIIEMGGVERRRIIDGIAGISHFDKDIEKAEEEKEEVDENLDRIKIILNEINSQIRQLKKDRDEAYRYKELKDQLYEVKAKKALKKKQEIEDQIAEVQKQVESYQKEREELEDKAKNTKEQYKEKQKKLEEIEQKIADVGGDEVKEIKEKIENIREEEIKVEERINYSNDEIKQLKEEEEELKNNLEQVKKELNNFEEEKNDTKNVLEEKTKTLEEKQNELKKIKDDIAQTDDKTMDLSHELSKMREEYKDKNNQVHELKLKRDRFDEQIEKLLRQIAELEEQQSTYSFELKDIKWQKKETRKEHNQKKKKKEELEKQLFNKKKQISELNEQLADLENRIRRLQRQQSKLQAEYDAAKTMDRKYNQAVNEILKHRDQGKLQGVHGTIAELADVEDKYKTAVETAAGGRMQSIVVDDDQVAAEAINILQEKDLGRATFLPLNKMRKGKPRGKPLMAIKDPKAVGFAIDLVDFRDKHRSAFWYVFRDTVVVESLDDARRLMGGVRLVDLKGSLVEASGAMRGGSKLRSRISFSKKDKGALEKVTEELNEATRVQDETSEKIKTLKTEIAEIENQMSEVKTVDEKEKHLRDLNVRKKEFSKKLERVKEELEDKKTEKEKLLEEKQQIEEKIKELQNRVKELDEIKEQKGKLLMKGTKKQLAQKARSLEETVTDIQDEVRSLQSNKETFDKKIELLEERKDEHDTKIEKIKQEIKDHRDNVEELKKKREEYRDKLQTLMSVEEKMTGKIKDLTEERDKIYRKTVEMENELDNINTKMESYYDLISRAKYRLPTLEESVEELNQELKLYDVEIKDKKLPNIESLKESINVIEENMRELEPVNMRALEEYEHQTERKNKLDEDVKHLKDQRKNLVKLVKNITNKKKERFYEVFDAVNENFERIYSQLSEGGKAELKLEDPDNVFESGLTIKARPRGKKVLLLDALSGGEKSIASLGFIFAIQQYDPSPVYVLDEVDMFLDGVNAETVSRMVKKNAQDSQFIMVSLRKIALKEADYVYGVTIRNNGVSDMIGNVDPSSVGPKGELNVDDGGRMNAVN
ncbi:MAG: chromosome segregation protein SMC [Candidatus Thermoplasmatota archaeon]